MKRLFLVYAAIVLTACASQEQTDRLELEQAILDYIEVRQLTELDKVRTGRSDSWRELDRKFVIYKTRREAYLVEFARNCYELNEIPVVPDMRREADWIRARFDTLRGCPISRLFALAENDVKELEAIGLSPKTEN